MGVPYKQTVVLVVLVVGGVLSGAAVTGFGSNSQAFGFGSNSQALTVDDTVEQKPVDSDVAFELRADLNNTGQRNVTKTLTLEMEAENSTFTADSTTVTVPAGETATVTLAAQSNELTPGRYSYELALDEDTKPLATGNVTLDQAAFAITDHGVEPVLYGEPATVEIEVHNHGDFQGMRSMKLLLDRNHDGSFDANETVAQQAPVIPSRDNTSLAFVVETDELEPGTYEYRIEGTTDAAEGTLTVKQPATFQVIDTAMSTNLTRGAQFNASVTLVNVGDVTGNEMLRLAGPTPEMDWNRSVTLRSSESTTLEFTAGTANLTRGNYSLAFTMANASRTETLRVRESHLAVAKVSGPDTVDIDEEFRVTATVKNTGDAVANQTVEYRIDLDDDDRPETILANRSIEVGPSERTTVEFTITGDNHSRVSENELLGTHVYGVYTEDSNATVVVVVDDVDVWTSSSTTTSTSTSDSTERVSRDVISQEKYGYYYDEVSSETQTQIDEIFERQPFADGLVVTEVLTREEIARQVFGLDVKRNDAFDFTSIDVGTQQKIEARFDAQFESETGDRIESWDEIAQQQFGTDYESLNETQQQTVRDRYQEQFDS